MYVLMYDYKFSISKCFQATACKISMYLYSIFILLLSNQLYVCFQVR